MVASATNNGNGNGTQLAQRKPDTLKAMFEVAKPKLAAVLPKHLSADRMLRTALMTITKTPALAKCNPQSLLMGWMEAGRLGLEIGGVLGEAYLVPYKDQATFIVGYRGLINLARRSGEIATIQAEVVRHGDEFDFEYGLETRFRHRPAGNTSADITHVWALAKFRDGSYQLCVMTKQEVDDIRSRSRAGQNGPWVTDYAEMAKKTAVRRLAKYLPLSPEMKDAIESSDTNEFGEIIDAETVQGAENADNATRQSKSAGLAANLRKRVDSTVIDPPADEQEQPEDTGEAMEQHGSEEAPGDEGQEQQGEPRTFANFESFRLACVDLAAARQWDESRLNTWVKGKVLAVSKVGKEKEIESNVLNRWYADLEAKETL